MTAPERCLHGFSRTGPDACAICGERAPSECTYGGCRALADHQATTWDRAILSGLAKRLEIRRMCKPHARQASRDYPNTSYRSVAHLVVPE